MIDIFKDGMILKNTTLSEALELIHSKVRPLSLTLAEQQAAKKIAYDYFPTLDASKNSDSCIAPLKPAQYYRDKFIEAQIDSLSSEREFQSWDFTSKLYLRESSIEVGVLVVIDVAPNYRAKLIELLQSTGFESYNSSNMSGATPSNSEAQHIDSVWDDAMKYQMHPSKAFYTYNLVCWDDFKSSVPYFEALINNHKPSNKVRAKLARYLVLKADALKFLKDGSLSYYEVIQKAGRDLKALEDSPNGYGIAIDELAIYR